jgi:hypothetical protein
MDESQDRIRLQEAQRLYKEQRWSEALAHYDALSIAIRSNPDIMFAQATCQARIGKVDAAEILCDQLTIMHQDPRGAQLKAQIPAYKLAENKDAKPEPVDHRMPRDIPGLKPAAFGLMGVALLVFVVVPMLGGGSSEPIIGPSIGFMPAPGERVLSFPTDRSLGSLSIRNWHYHAEATGGRRDFWVELTEARGDVTIPANRELRLELNPEAATDLASLVDLGPNAIQEIVAQELNLGESSLDAIGRLTGLFSLDLAAAKVPADIFARLRGLSSLRELNVINVRLGEDGRAFVLRQKYLTSFIADHANVDDTWVAELAGLQDLEFISLDYVDTVGDNGVSQLAQLRRLEHLFLSYTETTDAGLAAVQKIRPLTRIWLEGAPVSDASMAGFKTMPNIEAIGLANTAITDQALEHLAEVSTLRELDILGCNQLTPDGVRAFRQAQPNCKLETSFPGIV